MVDLFHLLFQPPLKNIMNSLPLFSLRKWTELLRVPLSGALGYVKGEARKGVSYPQVCRLQSQLPTTQQPRAASGEG